MRGPPERRRVVILAAPGSLADLDGTLRREGLRVRRLVGLVHEAEPVDRWLSPTLIRGDVDTVIVTSPRAVDAGVLPWLRHRTRESPVEFWAVGPTTARALRRAGMRRVRVGKSLGGPALARELGARPRRRILYLRSDRAGARLGHALARNGHAVAEAVVYRVAPPPPFRRDERAALGRADLLIVSSPSALSALRQRLAGRAFDRLRRRGRLVVLGPRSLRSARGHGFRGATAAVSSDAQRLTAEVLRRLRDAPS